MEDNYEKRISDLEESDKDLIVVVLQTISAVRALAIITSLLIIAVAILFIIK